MNLKRGGNNNTKRGDEGGLLLQHASAAQSGPGDCFSWPLPAKEVTNVGCAQHPHMGAGAKKKSHLSLLQDAPDSGDRITSPAPLCSHTSAILLLPPPGDVQTLDRFSDASPAPTSKSGALHLCNNSAVVAAEVSPHRVILACPTTPPAPPSYGLHSSGSAELSATRNSLLGMKTKPQSLEEWFFSKLSQAKSDGFSWLSRETSQQASAHHLLGHLCQSQGTKIALAASEAAFLLHILLLPCPRATPNPFFVPRCVKQSLQ